MTDSIEKERQRAIEEYRRIVAEIGRQARAIPPLLPFAHLHAFLACTPVIERIREAGAVIYERRAWAGGATDWYYCPDETQLKAIELLMGAGSIVEFFFGQRIESALDTPETKSRIIQLISELPKNSCMFIGTLSEDGIHIYMEDINHPDQLDFLEEIDFTSSQRIFYGKESINQNPKNLADEGDGFHTVKLTLPDADGVVRAHPH